jgi:CRISPR-associated protein Cas5h
MQVIQIIVEGNWGHFKRPETNNNPLTHDFITKTALIGMIGAVLGYEREEMKPLFPQLSDDLLYGVELVQPVKKISWGFTSRTAFKPWESGTPKYFEFLKNPCFKVIIALKNDNSKNIFDAFCNAVKNEEAIFTPVLGWHNCPANITFVLKSEVKKVVNTTESVTLNCFVSSNHKPQFTGIEAFRVGFENLPTFQNDDFWNLPDRYEKVIYPDAGNSISVKGDYFQDLQNNEKWWLI